MRTNVKIKLAGIRIDKGLKYVAETTLKDVFQAIEELSGSMQSIEAGDMVIVARDSTFYANKRIAEILGISDDLFNGEEAVTVDEFEVTDLFEDEEITTLTIGLFFNKSNGK